MDNEKITVRVTDTGKTLELVVLNKRVERIFTADPFGNRIELIEPHSK